MAQRVVVEKTDDLDGSLIGDGKGETVLFALDGKEYEIDLKAANAKTLRKSLEAYVAVAAKVGKATGKRGKRTQVASDAGAIREWCAANGIEVSERGRIPAEVRAKFEAAQKG